MTLSLPTLQRASTSFFASRSASLRSTAASLTACRRAFNKAVAKTPQSSDTISLLKGGWGPERYRTVPFVKEELRAVIEEVPDVKYYYIGDEDPRPYPYKDIPIDQKIDYEVLERRALEQLVCFPAYPAMGASETVSSSLSFSHRRKDPPLSCPQSGSCNCRS